MTASGMG